MKAYFSVSELLDFGLPELPKTKVGLGDKIKRENWQFREIAGRGGRGGKKREYMPPPEVQAAIVRQQQEQVLASAQFAALPVAASDRDIAPLPDGSTEVQRQRQREGARLGVQRGQVTLRRNVYYSAALQEYNGDRLRVAFDMHNAERVWLFDDDGRYVCHADWNGNRIDYMPVSVIEQAKEKRVAGQIKRLDNKQSILAAARPARVLEHQSRMNLGGRTLDMQALQQQAQLAMAKMQPKADEAAPPKAKVAAFRPSEPPPEGWVRPATPQARAAEFARLSALPPESWTAEQAKFMATPQVQQEAAALERMRQMYG